MRLAGFHLIIISLLVLFTSSKVKAKEDSISNKIGLKSFSLTPTNFFWSHPGRNTNSYFAGYAIIADVTFNYHRNLISFAPSAGFELLGSSKYVQLNLLYGREFILTNRWFLEAHAGVGYLYLEDSRTNSFFQMYYNRKFRSTVGFPIMGKLRFMTGENFSVGLLIQTNINSEFPIYSAGISAQWNLWNVLKQNFE